ncbi:MAG TPA: hypothetical protein VIK20_01985 [Bacteroidales bacterium]
MKTKLFKKANETNNFGLNIMSKDELKMIQGGTELVWVRDADGNLKVKILYL